MELFHSVTSTENGAAISYLEPNLDSLTDAMQTFAGLPELTRSSAAPIRNQVLTAFDWGQACERLSKLIADEV